MKKLAILKKKNYNTSIFIQHSYFLLTSNILKYKKYFDNSLNLVKFSSSLDCFFLNLSKKYNFFFFWKYLFQKKDFFLKIRFKKKIRIWPDMQCFIYYLHNKINQKKFFCFFCYFVIFFQKKVMTTDLGYMDKLEITGYSRRSWLSPSLNFMHLKVGHSFINKIIIPNKVFLNLFKKRFITIFSPSKRLLFKFSNILFLLKPITVYKNSGISLKSRQINFKERYIPK